MNFLICFTIFSSKGLLEGVSQGGLWKVFHSCSSYATRAHIDIQFILAELLLSEEKSGVYRFLGSLTG